MDESAQSRLPPRNVFLLNAIQSCFFGALMFAFTIAMNPPAFTATMMGLAGAMMLLMGIPHFRRWKNGDDAADSRVGLDPENGVGPPGFLETAKYAFVTFVVCSFAIDVIQQGRWVEGIILGLMGTFVPFRVGLEIREWRKLPMSTRDDVDNVLRQWQATSK